MYTNTEFPLFTPRQHPGRLYSTIKDMQSLLNLIHKATTGLRQPDPTGVPLEKENTEDFLKRLDTGADARLRYAERTGSVTEAKILGDRKCLAQGNERNSGVDSILGCASLRPQAACALHRLHPHS